MLILTYIYHGTDLIVYAPVHKRDLDALLLASGGRPPSKTRSFSRRVRIRGRPSTDDGDIDGNIGRSRSKSMGNEHERIYGNSYQGYRLAEERLKKSKSYGGDAASISSYVLSKYGEMKRLTL